jgi:phosphatidylinositol-3-phosphatase
MSLVAKGSRRTRTAAGLGTLVIGMGLLAGCATRPIGVTDARPCVGAATPVVYSHVVVLFMENKSFDQIIGSRAAPYINSLAASCGLATQYHGVTYPSEPNYLAATGGSTFGVANDNLPGANVTNASSIFSQTGTSWVSLSESMPRDCYPVNAYPYMVKHNPAPFYRNLSTACARQNVPLTSNPSFAPRYAFVTPNMLHDMHDGTITQGDTWLKTFVPKVINSPGYQAGTTVLLIVWDTDNGSSANRVPALIIAPQVKPHTVSGTAFNHYSLLRLSEELLNLPRLGNAATASDMRNPFHL